MPRPLRAALAAVFTFAATLFAADAPPPPPADPASAGDWIAFCSIRLPPDLAPEDRAAWASALARTLDHAASLLYPAGDPARAFLRTAMDEAAAGRPVDLAVPAPTPRQSEPPALPGISRVEPGAAAPGRRLARTSSDEWPAHREASSKAHRADLPPAVVEFAVNLNAARACGLFAPAFDPADAADGRAARILDALGLDNARVAGLHLRLIPAERVSTIDPSLPRPATPPPPYAGPPLAVIDATWSARSEPPGVVHRLPLTIDHWPRAQFGGDRLFERSAGVAALRFTWRSRVEGALRFAGGWLPPGRIPAFEPERPARPTSAKANLDRLCSALDPWAALSLDAPGAGPPGVSLRIPLRADSPPANAAADFDALLPGSAEGGGGGAAGPRRWRVTDQSPTPGVGGWWVRSVGWTLTPPAPGDGARAWIEGRIDLAPPARPDPAPARPG
ncbi:MAG: hypothetical protein ACK4WH_11125 [Phycisphaerales bacterium]